MASGSRLSEHRPKRKRKRFSKIHPNAELVLQFQCPPGLQPVGQAGGSLTCGPDDAGHAIAERIGWEHGLTVLKDRVRVLRLYFLPPNLASRTEYDAVHRVQCDLRFPPAPIPLSAGQVGSPPVLVMTASHSRMRWAVMMASRQAPDLIVGHWHCLQAWAQFRGSWSGTTSPRWGAGAAAGRF